MMVICKYGSTSYNDNIDGFIALFFVAISLSLNGDLQIYARNE